MRDWGHAKRLCRRNVADATARSGRKISCWRQALLLQFGLCKIAFNNAGLNWNSTDQMKMKQQSLRHVPGECKRCDKAVVKLIRITAVRQVESLIGDASKAQEETRVGTCLYHGKELAEEMVAADLELSQK